jgi:hypothetical protein
MQHLYSSPRTINAIMLSGRYIDPMALQIKIKGFASIGLLAAAIGLPTLLSFIL